MELKLDSKSIKEFHKFLKRNPDIVTKHTKVAMKKSIFMLKGQAQKEAPVAKSTKWHIGGSLRQNMVTSYNPLNATLVPIMKYAIYVHDGTRFQKKNPFLDRAMKKKQNRVIGFFKTALDKIITAIKNG